ncbi:MAG: hypothetical protein R2834_18785 [Rhodothermales bacterium]
MLNDLNTTSPDGRLFPLHAVLPLRHPLREPALFYHPPYETEAEDELAYHLVGTLDESAGLLYRPRLATSYASFDVAFVIEKGRQRIGIQVTRQAEPREPVDTAYHDTLLIDAGLVDILYRFDEADIEERLYDGLCVIARWNPSLFSERGLARIEAQASPAARAFQPAPGQENSPIALVLPAAEDEWQGESFVWPSEESGVPFSCRRMSRYHPAGWMREVDEALAHFGITHEQLRGNWARSA